MNKVRKAIVLLGAGMVLALFVPYVNHETRDSGLGGRSQTTILADDGPSIQITPHDTNREGIDRGSSVE